MKKIPLWLKIGLSTTLIVYFCIVFTTYFLCKAIYTGPASCLLSSLLEPADGPFGYPIILSAVFLISSFADFVISKFKK